MSDQEGANNAAGGQESKREAKNEEYIKLKVVSTDGNEIHFRVKMTTNIGKLKKSYADRVGVNAGVLRFLFEGRRLEDNETPSTLGMDDEDQIDAVQEQEGGAK